ncbi:SPOR domain-containing protein [Castellaniella sp.]|uniref:SPOR domain-containing protein n=1 Tax=Castellaniella sp. TaxID=1955812 RepID=UPI002AFE7D99|nr:SPOR domain-containing protein [Castellaniella sp.]
MLFRHGTDTGKRTATRAGGATEAQLKELRGKARRRLIGALALVLAAFIVVPWLFDEPVSDDTHAPVVVPATPAGLPPLAGNPAPADAAAPSAALNTTEGVLAQGSTPPTHTDGAAAVDASGGGVQNPQATAAAPVVAPAPDTSVAAIPPIQPPAPPPAASKPSDEPVKSVKPDTKPADRTDDGSVALALLSGKSPAAASSNAAAKAGQGRYYLQVAAYTTEQDAQSRRDSLRQSGVTDAYVERGQSGGRTVYRLRVGPFGSHEAAQAAQARLRALGYQNGLISDK